MSSNAVCAYLMDECSLSDVFDRVRAMLQYAVPDAAFTGVVMTDPVDCHRSLVFSADEPHAVAHSCCSDGPAVDALRSGRASIVADMASPGCDDSFRRLATSRGLRSVACVPMVADTHTVGVLTLYARSPGLFGRTMTLDIAPFATVAAYVLLNHQAYERMRTQCTNLERALVTRAPIEQAKGIIMASHHCTPDEAFETLWRRSQHSNVKVRALAMEMVERSSLDQPSNGTGS